MGREPGRVPQRDREKLWGSKVARRGCFGEKVGGEHRGLGPRSLSEEGQPRDWGRGAGLGTGEVRLKTRRAAQARGPGRRGRQPSAERQTVP